jgi:hypothetical protein
MLLRTASVLTFFQYSAHAYLFLSTVARSASTFGYGLMVILSGFVAAVLLWLLASLSKTGTECILPFVALLIFANAFHAFLAWTYFRLPAPVVFDALIAAVLLLAYVTARRQRPVRATHS